MNDMLPVGSKVRLKNGRILIIIGYLPNKPNDTVLFDYICCNDMYGIIHKKEDLILDRDYYYIKKEDVSEILYIGFNDKQFDFFNHYTDLVKGALLKAKKDKQELTQEDINEIYTNIMNKIKDGNGGDKDEK